MAGPVEGRAGTAHSPLAERRGGEVIGGRALLALALLAGLTSGGREAPTLTLALVGDVSLARGVARANRGDWGAALPGITPALRADATYGNLESPLTAEPHRGKGLDLRAPPAAVAALGPFTHLGVENNHARDGGAAGQAESRRTLRRAAIIPVTRHLTITRVGGVPVAWIAFLDDGRTPPPLAAVREGARRAGVVIVGVHWGAEYGPVTVRQRTLARRLAAAGATLIVGSGPHVLQGSERLGGALVLYSLGNLLFDQPYPDTWLGAVVRVRTGSGGFHTCAVPTRSRAGHVLPAPPGERGAVLARLGLPACPGFG